MFFVLGCATQNIDDESIMIEDSVSCKNLKSSAELSFGMSYCMGDQCRSTCDDDGNNCHLVSTKEECEAIDVVSEIDIESWNPDGKPDCKWDDKLDVLNACKPNK